MSMGKKEIDAAKKKGMALSDDAVNGVTDGETYHAVEPGYAHAPVHADIIPEAKNPALTRGFEMEQANVVKFNFEGDLNEAENYYRSVIDSTGFDEQ